MASDRGKNSKNPVQLEIVVTLVGGIAVPVIASLLLPSLPKGARVPVGIGIGAFFLVAVVVVLARYLRRAIATTTIDAMSTLGSYDVDRGSGTMLKGNITNVSLRIDTIHHMIDSIVAAVPADERKDVLYSAGQSAGASWARDFDRECRRADISMDDRGKKLDLWADYDASAGMGRLTFGLSEGGSGSVTVTNSFLSDQEASTPLNYWYAGYVAGTLSHILYRSVEATLESPTTRRQRQFRLRVATADAPAAEVRDGDDG